MVSLSCHDNMRKKLTYCGIVEYDKDVRVLSQLVQDSAKVMQIKFEGMKLLTHAGTCVLESFDEFGCAFVACRLELVICTVFCVCGYCGGCYTGAGR